jgi:crotonobetainyl-CoA:carnitine CoA-transferase CaiB-like acyl-CoA transferase
MGILSGYRVLDFGRYIAGPYCSAILAEFGADVIRIEKLGGSEDRWAMPVNDEGVGAAYMQLNRNKRSMTLNPTSEDGREIVNRLVKTADVVVANLPPSGLIAMGLDYATLKEIRHDIILSTISAFGHGGPYSERVGFDAIAQVMSGATYMSGTPEQPVRSFSPVVDFGSAMMLAIGTLVALMDREKSGEGQMVEGALLRTALTYMNPWIIEQALIEANRKPTMNRSQTAGPADILPTKDGWVLIQIVGRPLFERWAKMMNRADLLDDPRFLGDQDRGDNAEFLLEIARNHVKELTTSEAVSAYEAANLPAAPIYSPQQVLEDPHVQAMGFMQPIEYPNIGKPVPVAGVPVNLSRTPGQIRNRAPLLGEHTDTILEELGYTQQEAAMFHQKRVV